MNLFGNRVIADVINYIEEGHPRVGRTPNPT